MFKPIDYFLNRITMYRLVLYGLVFIWASAIVLGFFGLLPYSPLDIFASLAFIIAVCYFTNYIFAWVFGAPSNIESVYITAFILALLITPSAPFSNLALLFWVSVFAMASKYILAIKKKHIFNPAALAVVITAFAINQSASWWVGTAVLFPSVLVVGFLIVRKIRRSDLFFAFLISAVINIVWAGLSHGANMVTLAQQIFLDTPVLFFATVMLTEPATTPPTRKLRILYGVIVGILFGPFAHVGSVYSTPELALVVGNIFSYIVSPKRKMVLALQEKKLIAADTYEFIFKNSKPFAFSAGQYMEWTLGHEYSDNRGIRRYFTIASSPTENDIRMGVKFYQNPSTFKKKLLSLVSGDTIVASQLAGDFTLPRDKNKKLVFLAGGIGVTPFRSMIQYLIDHDERRHVTVIYSNKTVSDIAYTDVFENAERTLGIKTIHALSDIKQVPPHWTGRTGFVNGGMIASEVPDFKERIFYISGPQMFVDFCKGELKKIGVTKKNIKTDYFPGFA